MAAPLAFASDNPDPFGEQNTVVYGADIRRDRSRATKLFGALVDSLMIELSEYVSRERLPAGRGMHVEHFGGQPELFPEDNCQYALQLARCMDSKFCIVTGRFLMVHHCSLEGVATGTMQLTSLRGKDETMRQYVGGVDAAGRSEAEVLAAARQRQQAALPPLPVTTQEVTEVGQSVARLYPGLLPAIIMVQAIAEVDG